MLDFGVSLSVAKGSIHLLVIMDEIICEGFLTKSPPEKKINRAVSSSSFLPISCLQFSIPKLPDTFSFSSVLLAISQMYCRYFKYIHDVDHVVDHVMDF